MRRWRIILVLLGSRITIRLGRHLDLDMVLARDLEVLSGLHRKTVRHLRLLDHEILVLWLLLDLKSLLVRRLLLDLEVLLELKLLLVLVLKLLLKHSLVLMILHIGKLALLVQGLV